MNLFRLISMFQAKVGAPPPKSIKHYGELPACASKEDLLELAQQLESLSISIKRLFKKTDDNRLLRIELILEEFGEVVEAIANQDEEQLLDGLVDLAYAVIGTAVTFDLPFNAAFAEIHRSNMTKSPRVIAHNGDKGKGEGFSPANLKPILEKYVPCNGSWPKCFEVEDRANG